MNGKIDKDGFLHIERAGVMKRQECPFTASSYGGNRYATDEHIRCGDRCPRFGEIYGQTVMDIVDYGKNEKLGFEPTSTGKLSLTICHGKELIFDTLTDERGAK